MAHLRVRRRQGGEYLFLVYKVRGQWHERAVGRDKANANLVLARARYEEAKEIADSLYGEGLDAELVGRIYFVQAVEGGPVKIGFTSGSVKDRLFQLQCMSPVQLKTLISFRGTRRDEGDLHKRFAGSRAHGEWFLETPDLIELVKRVRAERSSDGRRGVVYAGPGSLESAAAG